MTEPELNTYPCTECQAGVMRLEYLTYFTWLGEELVTVPNFPAWVCDVCGRREYDQRAIAWLVALLNPETGKATVTRRRLQPLAKKRDATRPSTS